MRKQCILLVILISCSAGSRAQEDRFFEKKPENLMPIGAYYYPEHWNENQWERDIRRMAELGFSFTHFAEFAWAKIEPEEGRFDFTWLDRNIELADQYGLKVILCTPSPAPPAWLTQKHPEVLLENEDGMQQQHGSRLFINSSNPTYMKYVERVVTEMAKRYGNDVRIWGWQIDNEPHFGTLYDYSQAAESGFRNWLKQKYKDINTLNDAWGAAFWSNTYNTFEQIRIPNAKRAPQGANPHALLDFRRYTADALASTIRHQNEILRRHISGRQWVTTNYAYYKFLPSVDLFRNRGDYDFASHTMYLLSTALNYPDGRLGHRLGSGMELSFSNELAKSVHGYTGIMELQPGQINWGKYNAQPYPGAVRMWIWHCFGLNDRFVCTYRFRQPIDGGEHYHKGIMETDGVTLARGGEEFVSVIDEIKGLRQQYTLPIPEPQALKSRKTAFLWKQDNLLEMDLVPHTTYWDTWQHVYTYYQKLKTLGAPVHFVTEDEAVTPQEYPFLVAPSFNMISEANVKRWRKYAEDGGHLILTCRTGQKDNDGHLHETLLQQPIWDLIGAEITDNDQLPPERPAQVQYNGQKYAWHIWGEWLKPRKETEVWAHYASEFYKDTPAVVSRKVGKGTVTYIGVWTDDGNLEQQIICKVYQQAGAEILSLPDYVFVEWRDGFWVAVNYSSEAFDLPLETQPLIGRKTIEPGEVTVWK